MKRLLATFAIFVLFNLTACGPIMFTLPYQPVTTAELQGNVDVQKFSYTPKEGVKPNQIRNTAAGTMLLTENADDYFTNAVKREFRQAGISLKQGAQCTLSGELNDFAVDDLGYSVTHISNAHYILSDTRGKVLYDSIFDVKFDGSKFVVVQVIMANLNKTIADNINKLLADPDFQKILAASCSTTGK